MAKWEARHGSWERQIYKLDKQEQGQEKFPPQLKGRFGLCRRFHSLYEHHTYTKHPQKLSELTLLTKLASRYRQGASELCEGSSKQKPADTRTTSKEANLPNEQSCGQAPNYPISAKPPFCRHPVCSAAGKHREAQHPSAAASRGLLHLKLGSREKLARQQTLYFIAAKVGWHTQTHTQVIIIYWNITKAESLTDDLMAAAECLWRSLLGSLHTVFRRKWLCTDIWVVNDIPLCHA